MSPTAFDDGRDLDDVAEQLVDFGVHAADFAPAVGQPDGFGLLETGSCTGRRAFRAIHVGRAGHHAGLEGRIELADRLPIFGDLLASGSKSSPVSRGVKRSASTSEFKFGCEVRPDKGAMAASAMSSADFGRLEHRRRLHAAGVVRVKMDRDADLLLERLHQLFGRVGLAQAGHVLDGQDVRRQFFQFLGQLDVVFQVVLGPLRGRGCRRCSRWPPRTSRRFR